MYSYIYDVETGGILLNSSPTNFSKEPRPVYASELDLLGFDKYWKYEKQNDVPYLWAEAGQYLYRGQVVARVKGGSIYSTPEIILSEDENGNVILPEGGGYLKQIDIQGMIYKNQDILNIIEETTVKKIIGIYQKYLNRVDIFHVAFSGGKDSLVLLDLVRRALPKKSFVVVFGDTGMEFPDTYKLVEQVKKECEGDEIPFYVSHSHFKPCESWKLFGPPARVLRWCCSVHKSAPQTLKLREITGKNDYVGMDFVGVRKHESVSRSEYEYENFGKKQKGQYSHNSILEWTSAEVWLYIFSHNLPVNEAYKKGNSRAGCLFCPMGGGKGDYLQFHSYPDEVGQYVEMIKSMNGRYKTEEELQSYVANGGWNARKNGRDLAIEKHRYEDKTQDGKVIISVSNPTTDWREWIKTVGELPFDFSLEETKNGYKVIFDAKMTKSYPKEAKKLKQVFKKASSCVGCRVCETNCRNGCISFKGGLSITDCIACGQCHEIDDGCLVYHSLRSSTGGNGMRKGSLNSFANHAPKTDWVREFFEVGNDFWELNSLGPNQVPMFKRFLRECNIVDKENKTTKIYDLISELGWESEAAWGIILSNLAYNPQVRWYIDTLDVGNYYSREQVSEILIGEGVSKNDATSIINAFKRFCELPLGTTLGWGMVIENGRQVDSLSRCKCTITNNLIVMYSLFLFAEKCNNYREFTLSWLMNDNIERDGVSPSKMFGLDYESMKSILMGVSARYPDFIDASFTNDLDKITLLNRTSEEVLELFREV